MTTDSPRYAVNLSLLFTELPLLQRPAAAKEAGFDAVEFWWPFADRRSPADADVDAFVTAVTDAGVQLIGLNFFAGDMPGGDRGLVSWPARSGEFRDNIDVTVGIGERLGCTAFNALYGNRVDDATPAASRTSWPRRTSRCAAAAAGRIGGDVLVEPVSGAPRYPLLHRGRRRPGDRPGATASRALTNVEFLCDLYHLASNGDDVAAAIAAYADRSGTCRSPTAPAAANPAPARWTSTGTWPRWRPGATAGTSALEYKPTVGTRDSLAWLPLADRAAATHVG